MAEHIESSLATKSALQLGAQYKYDGKTYVLVGFHPGALVMKDSDGKWYDAAQYATFDAGKTLTAQEADANAAAVIDQKMIFVRRASDFADKFERVV